MRRSRAAVLGVTLALLAVFVIGGAAASAAKTKSSAKTTTTTTAKTPTYASAHDLTPAPSCPAEDNCVTIPGTSSGPEAESGGTVQAGPTQNLGDNQWVYINTYGFEPGTDLEVDWCTNTAPLATAQPLCLSKGYPLIANIDYGVQTLADGTESLSYQVLELDPSDVPFTGQEPGDSSVSGTFWCNATTPCSVDVESVGVDAQGSTVMTSDNTAVIPITFATSGSGCGSNAASVDTESEYGIEFLLPVAAAASCSLSDPSVAFNTADDGLSAVTSLSTGSTEVAFTDNPESTDQQQTLTQGNYHLIPVALSANVVGFKAQEGQGGTLFPLNAFDLSPLMVAGLLTGSYDTPGGADDVSCTGETCPVPPCVESGKKAPKTCGLFNMANYEDGFDFPQQFESFVRSDSAGSNGLLYEWLCSAPNVGVPVSIAESDGTTVNETFTEPITAAQELDELFATSSTPLKKCPVYDQLPPEAQGSAVVATGYNDPNQQEIKINNYVAPGLQGAVVNAGFSTMNWAEAHYYGMRVAALQNADGQFVLPSQASLDAAVADGTVDSEGILVPDYSTKDPNAYPMPSVIYAAVCSDPQPSAQAMAISDMLTQLLAVSGSGSTATLPQGFVPLPSSLTSAAQADIAKDVVGGGSAPLSGCPPAAGSSTSGGSGGTTSSGTTNSGTTSGTSGGSSSAGAGASTSANVSPVVEPGSSSVTGSEAKSFPTIGKGGANYSGQNSNEAGSHAGTSGLGAGGGAGGGAHVGVLSLSSSSSRVLLPLALLLGLLALVLGGFLLFSPTFREQLLGVGRSVQDVARRGRDRVRPKSGTPASFSRGSAGRWR